MVKPNERIRVDPEFKRKLKIRAAMENKSLLDLTKELIGEIKIPEKKKTDAKEKKFKPLW